MKNRKIKRIGSAIFMLLLLMQSIVCVGSADAAGKESEKIAYTYEQTGFTEIAKAFDSKQETYSKSEGAASITVNTSEDIGFIYVEFNHAPGVWAVSSGSKNAGCGDDGFIHEFVDIENLFGDCRSLTMSFPGTAEITDIYVYGKGEVPDTVQRWEPECEQADILLLSAHSDDDQLYFAGLIPYYAQVRGVKVQVVFFTEHLEENYRWHERLNSLWTAGLKYYPVVSRFPDAYSTSLDGAWTKFQNAGYTQDAITEWVAFQICRFRPLVAVTHSYKGESGGVYANGAGHGQHMAAARALTDAADLAASSSIGGYAAYDLPKLYIHCYTKDNDGNNIAVTLKCIDETYAELGGLSPFNVSQNAFLCHESQYLNWTAIKQWMWGTNNPVTKPETITVKKASDIKVNSPRYYGLARMGAGITADKLKNDLFENVVPYGERSEEQTTAEVITSEITSEVITTAEVTTAEDTAQESSGDTSTADPGSAADTQNETKSPESSENTRTFDELQYAKKGRKALLVILTVVAVVALVIILYIGIQIIRKCKNP